MSAGSGRSAQRRSAASLRISFALASGKSQMAKTANGARIPPASTRSAEDPDTMVAASGVSERSMEEIRRAAIEEIENGVQDIATG